MKTTTPVHGTDPDYALIVEAVDQAKVHCVHPTAATTIDIGRAVLAAERLRAALASPVGADVASDDLEPHMKRCDEMRDELYEAKREIARLEDALAAGAPAQQSQPVADGSTAALLAAQVALGWGGTPDDSRKALDLIAAALATPVSGATEDQPARELAMAYAALLQAQPRSPQPGAWKVHNDAIAAIEHHLSGDTPARNDA